jgi:hypothetical protein
MRSNGRAVLSMSSTLRPRFGMTLHRNLDVPGGPV